MSESEEDRDYVAPKREVQTPSDMVRWTKTEAYHEYVGFVLAMNERVKGKKLTDDFPVSEVTSGLLRLLETLDAWVEETPPVSQPQRFGNSAFRTWLQKVHKEAEELLREALPEDCRPAVVELFPYLQESFGNMTRIDYGTGHEMSFAMFLCCLFKIGAWKEEDSAAAILGVFERYLRLVRRLQLEYRMEPAGSHGVWSLDDYQFLPFIWGSAQLVGGSCREVHAQCSQALKGSKGQFNAQCVLLAEFKEKTVAKKRCAGFIVKYSGYSTPCLTCFDMSPKLLPKYF